MIIINYLSIFAYSFEIVFLMEPKNVSGAEAYPTTEKPQKEKKEEPPAKKKLFPYAIACSCWAAKQARAELGQETTEHGQSKKKLKHLFNQFVSERDHCEACQPETPRTAERCSCKEAYQYLMSLFPPIKQANFQTPLQMACAELDWHYERLRCLYCKNRDAVTNMEEALAASMKKKFDDQPGWVMFGGFPVKIVMKEMDENEDKDLFHLLSGLK